ncbi:hypothetical protein [Desulfobotulus sp.]|uniref:VpaChn25_0724 family phage protein n=1 Tax=Desulfobotulus sp. TaxID=1940337 RepID=UPI002A366ABF|nr:hypothetical protein [Desulfobotulus sp.]MDY0164648.1 ArsR family transcriptional regulator [Desulfobotulus sp.]
MGYERLITEDRRLVLLRLLEASEGYTANAYLLTAALPDFGHTVSHDRVCTELGWLAEQGLATVSHPGGVAVATLTTRGADVAGGRARVAGVKRPLPGV